MEGKGCSFEGPLSLPSTKWRCLGDLPLMFPGRSGLCSCSPAWQEATLWLLVQEIKALSNGVVHTPPFISSEHVDDFCGKLVAVSN